MMKENVNWFTLTFRLSDMETKVSTVRRVLKDTELKEEANEKTLIAYASQLDGVTKFS